MVLRYSHDIISIVSQFPRRITPFGLKNFAGGPSVDQVNGWSTFVGASWWALTAEEPTIPPSLFPALDKFPSFISLPFCTLGAHRPFVTSFVQTTMGLRAKGHLLESRLENWAFNSINTRIADGSELNEYWHNWIWEQENFPLCWISIYSRVHNQCLTVV